MDSNYDAVPGPKGREPIFTGSFMGETRDGVSGKEYISPRGTLHMGKIKIMETGIYTEEGVNSAANSFSNSSTTKLDSLNDLTGSRSRKFLGSKRAPASLGGKKDFIEIGTLGSGASGVVSEAIHLPTLTIVALKMLPVYNQEKRQNVARELGVLYKNLVELRLVDEKLNLDHNSDVASHRNVVTAACPNVLSLYNAFVDPKSGMINLVMEYMDGGSLEDLVREGGCRDERVLADIACQTVRGLSFLHKNKLIHRDIKPANILCSSEGFIKIADFGISKALDKTSGFANSFVGTVCYMSPERITGDTYGYPCDIWSLGLTLLAVSQGRFPIHSARGKVNVECGVDATTSPSGAKEKIMNEVGGGAGGYWAMIQAVCDDAPPFAGDSFSPQFNKFIDACLRKKPDDRLSADQLLGLSFVTEATSIPMSIAISISLTDDDNSFRHATTGRNQYLNERNQTPTSGQDEKEATIPVDYTSSLISPVCKATALLVRDKKLESPAAQYHRSKNQFVDSNNSDSSDQILDSSPSNNDFRDQEMKIITAIRLEHLDRVLQAILRKIKRPTSHSSSFDTFDISDDDYDDDETNERDVDGLHLYQPEEEKTINVVAAEKNVSILSEIKPVNDRETVRSSKCEAKVDFCGPDESAKKRATNGSILKTSQRSESDVSARSVHFNDPTTPDYKNKNKKQLKSGRKLGDLPALSFGLENSFRQLSSVALSQQSQISLPPMEQKKESKSSLADAADTRTSIDPSSASWRRISPSEIRQILPKLNADGIGKWANLANQLHLPLALVLIGVKSTFAHSDIDLDFDKFYI